MALGDIGKKISQAGQNVLRGTKDLADTTKMNSIVTEEQRKLGNVFMQIGHRYYERHVNDPDEELADLCAGVTASLEKIASLREEISRIKGVRKCPQCGAEVSVTFVFCGACGWKAAQGEPGGRPDACPNCGAALKDGAAFCTECGQRL